MPHLLALIVLLFATTATNSGEFTLKVVRGNGITGAWYSRHIFLNGTKLGTISAGEEKTFKCKVINDENVFSVKEDEGTILSNYEHRFRVWEGGEVRIEFGYRHIKYEVQNWRLTPISESVNKCDVIKIGNVSADIVKMVLDKKVTEKTVATEVISAIPGVKTSFKRSRTIEHAVDITVKDGTNLAVKSTLGLIEAEIKKEYQTSEGKSIKKAETKEHTIEMDGNKISKIRLIWVDTMRTGTVVYNVGGKQYTSPFSLQTETELRIEKVE